MDRIVDNIRGLNEETEQFIEKDRTYERGRRERRKY